MFNLLLISSKKVSLKICESVNVNAVDTPLTPDENIISFIKSLNYATLKSLVISTYLKSIAYINEASLISDYLPEPPTPTKRAEPPGKSIILAILEMCSIAWSNNTRFMLATDSLYSSSFASSTPFKDS